MCFNSSSCYFIIRRVPLSVYPSQFKDFNLGPKSSQFRKRGALRIVCLDLLIENLEPLEELTFEFKRALYFTRLFLVSNVIDPNKPLNSIFSA